jgi:hypothetical protein
LPRKAVMAFRSAGATEEMIASARLIYGSLPNEPPGRPRMYKTAKEADHAYYMRHRDRFRRKREISPNKAPPPEILAPAAEQAVPDTEVRVVSLKGLLVDAAGGNVDREADVLTISALLDKGCDLEADILPTVARMVPELRRPLKNWGAQWLVREILEARDRRLFPTLVIRRPLADEDYDASGVSPVEAALNILDGGLVALRPAPEMARSDFRREPENL